MAILTGAITYLGSFKSIRHYRNLYDPTIYAGEKGGANRDLIMTHPAFARTRENMSEFGGCSAAVKSIRRGLQDLLPEKADAHFTGRLMKMAKEINVLDLDGFRGRRSIFFSMHREVIQKLVFNTRVHLSEMMQSCYSCSHASPTRESATLSVSGLSIKQTYVPVGSTHFRLLHHLSVVSDWVFSETNRWYEPVSGLNGVSELDGMSAMGYSAYTSVLSDLTCDVIVTLPLPSGIDTLPPSCSVIQCIGIEFSAKSPGDVYLPYQGGCMKVAEVF
jgi:hypothetical protein